MKIINEKKSSISKCRKKSTSMDTSIIFHQNEIKCFLRDTHLQFSINLLNRIFLKTRSYIFISMHMYILTILYCAS